MFKYITLAFVTGLTALTLGSLPVKAQTPATTDNIMDKGVLLDLNRAKNLARQAAERANGGLGYYRAESSMHGPASQAPYVDNGNESWTFTFKGTKPGETTPSYESVVTVSKDGNVIVDYNGSVRSATP